MNFSLTKEQAQRYDEITRTFVWAATHPQVHKARLSQPVEKGGINLVDVNTDQVVQKPYKESPF